MPSLWKAPDPVTVLRRQATVLRAGGLGVLREAELRPLGMIGVQPHFGPDDPAGIALADGVLRAVAPLIERTGVATAQEIGVETFGQRLRDELQRNAAVPAPGILLSAWATTGAQLD